MLLLYYSMTAFIPESGVNLYFRSDFIKIVYESLSWKGFFAMYAAFVTVLGRLSSYGFGEIDLVSALCSYRGGT